MSLNAETAVRQMAEGVLAQLAQPVEYEPFGGGLLVDPFVPDDVEDRYPNTEWFRVSFGDRRGWRVVEVSVVPTTQDTMRLSLANAAWQVADAFQDEVIELLGGDARPACPGHPHPMVPRVQDAQAWWTCPRDADVRRPMWPN